MTELRLLGPVELVVDGRSLDLGPAKRRAVFAALAVDAGRPVPVDTLVARVWDDAPPAEARNALYAHVARLRQALTAAGDAARLDRTRGGYLLSIDADRVDLHLFRRLTERARQPGLGDADRRALLCDALALWRATPLAELSGRWAERVREGCAQGRLDAVLALARTELRLGEHEAVIDRAHRELADNPLAEPLVGVLMRALRAAGRTAEALDCYAAIRRRLADELGVDPGAELRELHQEILRGQDEQPRRGPAQLPVDVRGFAGRETELGQLDRLPDPRSTVVAVISGTPGVGKTALAVHWAHRVAARFPDGQLYVNLRGFDPGGSPLEPAEAVRGFLEALGVPPQQIPAALDAQAALYRTTLAGRRMLVVLDNARDAGQLQPLIAGSAGCLILVTSRSQMPSLVTAAGAYPIVLDVLSRQEASGLLARRIGTRRAGEEPAAIDDIVAHSAGLPLALSIVAARAATHPDFPLAAMAAELRDIHSTLDSLDAGDPATSVRTAFSWSYRTLSAGAARLFRLLSQHAGPDIGRTAAAGLAGVRPQEVRPLLAELARAHLLTEHRPGRYAAHDLLRAYAAELAVAGEPESELRAARHRVLEYYLHTAVAADRHLAPGRDPLTPIGSARDVMPETITDHDQALAWFAAEHANLLAAVEQAAAGFEVHAWQLAWAVANFLDRRGLWHDWAAVARVAVDAAQRLEDPRAQAQGHRGLALAYVRLGRYADARRHYQQTLDRFDGLADVAGQAHTYQSIGMLDNLQGRRTESIRASREALRLYHAIDHVMGQARTLNSLGWLHTLEGDHRQAIAYCEQALTFLAKIDDRLTEAGTWDSLGYAHLQLGEHRQAIDCFEHALRLFRDIADRYNEADILTHLGDAHRAAGSPDSARDAWRRAHDILLDIGHDRAGDVRTKLESLEEQRD